MHTRRIALGALLLAGCATTTELRDRGPVATFSSAAPPETVATCIRDAWSTIRMGLTRITAGMAHVDDVYTLTSEGAPPNEMADVLQGTSGTEVRFYSQAGIMAVRTRHFTDAIDGCTRPPG